MNVSPDVYAVLGGYLNRKNDPPPGNAIIWRGLNRLHELKRGFLLANICGQLNVSPDVYGKTIVKTPNLMMNNLVKLTMADWTATATRPFIPRLFFQSFP